MGRGKNIKDIDGYITSASENIENDRALALTLLTDLMKSMNNNYDHKELGQVASKYLETLQRSNEQLVKIAGLVHKRTATKDGLTSQDKEDIFDLINKSED
tara:strand:+ start:4579 stop:4881 length:303 start_codon:yes stop_codon:yes gene_type:complete